MAKDYYALVTSNIAFDSPSKFEEAVRAYVPRGGKKLWSYWSVGNVPYPYEYEGHVVNVCPRFMELTGRGDMRWTKNVSFFKIQQTGISDLVNQRFLFSATDTMRPYVFGLKDVGRFAELVPLVLAPAPDVSFKAHVRMLNRFGGYLRDVTGCNESDESLFNMFIGDELKTKFEESVAHYDNLAANALKTNIERYAAPLRQEFLDLIEWVSKQGV